MGFKDLGKKDCKKDPVCSVEGPDCKESCPSTEFSKELTPQTGTTEDCDTCKR